MSAIKPIFKNLSNSDLLKKCLHNGIQNPNESVKFIIWSRIPKTTFIRLSTLRFSVYEVITCFNRGSTAKCLIFDELSMKVGNNCVEATKKKDIQRIRRAEIAVLECTKKVRQKKNLANKILEELYTSEEDANEPSYSAGKH